MVWRGKAEEVSFLVTKAIYCFAHDIAAVGGGGGGGGPGTGV